MYIIYVFAKLVYICYILEGQRGCCSGYFALEMSKNQKKKIKKIKPGKLWLYPSHNVKPTYKTWSQDFPDTNPIKLSLDKQRPHPTRLIGVLLWPPWFQATIVYLFVSYILIFKFTVHLTSVFITDHFHCHSELDIWQRFQKTLLDTEGKEMFTIFN